VPALAIESIAFVHIRGGTCRYFASCAAAKSFEHNLCDYAGAVNLFDVKGSDGLIQPIYVDLGLWSYGTPWNDPQITTKAKGATAIYKPGMLYARKANQSYTQNYDSNGRCNYYADAANMGEFQTKVGQIVSTLVDTMQGLCE
jgi:hypothetical protein